MFAANLDLDAGARERAQRLVLSGLAVVAASMGTLAGIWSLEQLAIDRVGPPERRIEIAQLSFLPPPPTKEAPAAPAHEPRADTPAPAAAPAPRRVDEEEPRSEPVASDSTAALGASSPEAERSSGIPDALGGVGQGCPGGVCSPIDRGISPPRGTCVGPNCARAPGGERKGPGAPLAVGFSALNCLSCPDPSESALRKTAAGVRRRGGRIVTHFCVDPRGRVEPESVRIERSFGEDEVDRIVTKTVSGWRFSPMRVDAAPRRACSETTFEIRFR
ncbi:TonB family protein [Pseudenhygromyxa sp. WMMC2535]|uniref:TonB family protein n=1 Tax=Pseudenhygromyxa sp. WMMC2535 TaxID=2712867 RepID=UPI001553617C|nr:TonB family protein [Pseudenhygromyxa sp. WMMC2535]NVB41863.1 TonB family protein [Pseudenhygromyxa sp. WMMC2535]